MNIRLTKTSVCKLFSAYVVLIPILQYYNSPIPAFNLATLLAMLFGVFFFVFRLKEKAVIRKKSFQAPAWIYILFITGNVIITSFLYRYEFSWDNNKAYVRLFVLFLTIIVLGNRYFNFDYALKALERILTISGIAIIINVIFFTAFHADFKLVIRPLLSDTISVGTSIRSGGMYMEPAHYAQSAILYLICYIFSDKKRLFLSKKSFYMIIAGILFSTSGQGYAMLAFVYAVWLVYSTFISNSSMQKKILVVGSVLAVAIAIVLMYHLSFVQYAVSRIIDDEGNIGGRALSGRTWTNYKFYLLPDIQRYFGVGFGHIKQVTSGYVNSMYSYLIQCGYPSLALFIIMGIYYFVHGDLPMRIHLIFFAVMYYFSGIASAMSIMLYFSVYSAEATMNYLEKRQKIFDAIGRGNSMKKNAESRRKTA